MISLFAASEDRSRRHLLKLAAATAGSAPLSLSAAQPPTGTRPDPQAKEASSVAAGIGKGLVGYMLAHEQRNVSMTLRQPTSRFRLG
jgi:hypothetical protein